MFAFVLYLGLMAGWFDACTSYANSPDRRGAFDFTVPYLGTGAHFAVKSGNPSGFSPDMEDLSGFTLSK